MSYYNLHEPAGIGMGAGGTVPLADEATPQVTANPICRAFGHESLATPTSNPNHAARGRMVVFGSRIQRKRGLVGLGNQSYDKEFRHDARLGELPPPLVP